MQFEFWYTLILIIALTIVLIKEILKPEIAIFSVLILLIIGNVITVKEAFSGFSNEGMLTLGLLFVVAGALQTTGVLERLSQPLFGKSKGRGRAKLARISLFTVGASAFLNNTPIVAMLIPSVRRWAEKNNVSLSKFLIPISYAAIFGGMCTLIGTSTNLIIHGLMIENGLKGFTFFELSGVGIPIAVIGLLYILLAGYKLLPNRKPPMVQLGENIREFEVELKVTGDYKHIGETLEHAGLRRLKGLYLFQIERKGKVIAPAEPEMKILESDRLFFTGVPKTILELQKQPGFQLIKDSSFDLKHYDSDEIKTFEAVISPSSELVGKKIRYSNFRERFGAVILAIHRNGERINKKIGDVYLKPGDTLLLFARKSFKRKWYNSNEFHLISESDEIHSKPKWQELFSLSIFFIMVVLAALEIIPLITAMGIAAILLFISKSISGQSAIDMVDWKVLIIIASSFGIAIAMEKSLVGEYIAELLVNSLKPLGVPGILAGIYLITAVYTNFITNNTAAVLMFPIALSIAAALNTDVHPFAIAIAIGASSSFATPLSYQTNLMVYGPGGYKFKDFIKIGLPLQFIVAVCAIFIIYYLYI